MMHTPIEIFVSPKHMNVYVWAIEPYIYIEFYKVNRLQTVCTDKI